MQQTFMLKSDMLYLSWKYEGQRSLRFRIEIGGYEETEGVQLSINRKASGLGNVKCHVFIFAEAQLHIINQELESVTY